MVTATEASFDPEKCKKFGCERAVAYVLGRVTNLVQPWGEGIYLNERSVPLEYKQDWFCPTATELFVMYPVMQVPQPLSIALVRTPREVESYHIGLVLDTNSTMIWSKQGDLPVDVQPASVYLSSGHRVDYLNTNIAIPLRS